MTKILLSYRRADAIETAARIFNYLYNYCGHGSVFSPDSETHPAATFRQHIYEQVHDSDIVLVVMGPNWIGKRRAGTPFIQNEFDPVRLLLREVIKQNKIMTPILVDGALMPRFEDLPQDVSDICYMNGFEVNTDRFDSDMTELIRRIGVLPSAFKTSRSPRDASVDHRQHLVLFIHGLGGDAHSTWGDLPTFLLQDPPISATCDVAYHRFPTSLFRIPFSRRAPKIQELAAGLRSQMKNRYADYSGVALVCHSLGGLIARRYIIEEVKDNQPLRVRRLALFAVPNNGAALASIGQFISWRHGQLKQLCRDADVIELMNEDWARYDIQGKIVSKFIVGTQDRVVDRFSAAGYWGNPDLETVIGKGHINLVKPVTADDDAVFILQRFIRSMVVGADEVANSPKPERGATSPAPN